MSDPMQIWDEQFPSRHLEFTQRGEIPFEQGRVLGRGGNGVVYETKFKGIALAWKRSYVRVLGESQLNEIKIMSQMRRAKHVHIVELIGSYVLRGKAGGIHELGLLISPIAQCDLGTFIWEVDKMTDSVEESEEETLISNYHGKGRESVDFLTNILLSQGEKTLKELGIAVVSRLCTVFGCIAHAIQYLHNQKIRHRDLKPAQILISRDGLWVTDFGWSKDISELNTSATANGETITAMYQSPERAQMQPTGRPEDIFSMGCIFLEMAYATSNNRLRKLENLRSDHDRSFQANIGQRNAWIAPLKVDTRDSMKSRFLASLIEQTLSRSPDHRPRAEEVVAALKAIDSLEGPEFSLIGRCCSVSVPLSTRFAHAGGFSISEDGDDRSELNKLAEILVDTRSGLELLREQFNNAELQHIDEVRKLKKQVEQAEGKTTERLTQALGASVSVLQTSISITNDRLRWHEDKQKMLEASIKQIEESNQRQKNLETQLEQRNGMLERSVKAAESLIQRQEDLESHIEQREALLETSIQHLEKSNQKQQDLESELVLLQSQFRDSLVLIKGTNDGPPKARNGYRPGTPGGYGSSTTGGYEQKASSGYGPSTPTGFGQNTSGGYGPSTPTGFGQNTSGGYGSSATGGYEQKASSGYGSSTPTGFGQSTSGGYRQSTIPSRYVRYDGNPSSGYDGRYGAANRTGPYNH